MNRCSTVLNNFILTLVSVLLLVTVCSGDATTPQDSAPSGSSTTTTATGAEVTALPPRGKVRSDTTPPKAVIGMIWIDTITNTEYIFDGNVWVPHVQSVETPPTP